jgi:transposase-like protein
MMRKRYTPVQKAAIVLELFKEEETLPQIASRHGVRPNLLRKWKAQALEGLPHLFTDDEQDRRAAAAPAAARVRAGTRTTEAAWYLVTSNSERIPI